MLPTLMTLGIFPKASDYMGFSAFILKIVLSCPLAKRTESLSLGTKYLKIPKTEVNKRQPPFYYCFKCHDFRDSCGCSGDGFFLLNSPG